MIVYQIYCFRYDIYNLWIGCQTGWGWWFLLKLRISKGWSICFGMCYLFILKWFKGLGLTDINLLKLTNWESSCRPWLNLTEWHWQTDWKWWPDTNWLKVSDWDSSCRPLVLFSVHTGKGLSWSPFEILKFQFWLKMKTCMSLPFCLKGIGWVGY